MSIVVYNLQSAFFWSLISMTDHCIHIMLVAKLLLLIMNICKRYIVWYLWIFIECTSVI